jgi:hypothetical protein
MVSNLANNHFMRHRNQFRMTLPVSQTVLAAFLGGWGLWLRNSILSRPFWGDSTLWNSTARYHIWPWPFKFAAVLNMPAFAAGALLSLPLDALRPGLPEWCSALTVLPFVALLWYRIGVLLDGWRSDSQNKTMGRWITVLVFTVICAAASSIPEKVGGYTSYIVMGIVVWTITAIGLRASIYLRKREAAGAQVAK